MRRVLLTFLLAGLVATGALAVTAEQYLAYLGLFGALAVCLSVLTLGSTTPKVQATRARRVGSADPATEF